MSIQKSQLILASERSNGQNSIIKCDIHEMEVASLMQGLSQTIQHYAYSSFTPAMLAALVSDRINSLCGDSKPPSFFFVTEYSKRMACKQFKDDITSEIKSVKTQLKLLDNKMDIREAISFAIQQAWIQTHPLQTDDISLYIQETLDDLIFILICSDRIDDSGNIDFEACTISSNYLLLKMQSLSNFYINNTDNSALDIFLYNTLINIKTNLIKIPQLLKYTTIREEVHHILDRHMEDTLVWIECDTVPLLTDL